MRYFTTPIDQQPKSKFIMVTPVGVKAVKPNKYLSKYSSLEKQAFNPLALFIRGGVHLAGEGGGAFLSKMIGSKGFQSASKFLGSQGTVEGLAASKNPFIQKEMGNLTNVIKNNAGAERFVDVSKTINPGVAAVFKESVKPTVTFANAWKNNPTAMGKVQGISKVIGHHFGIGDSIGSNLRKSLYDSYFASSANPGAVYKGSRVGNLTKNIANKGIDAYFIGDAFLGSVNPGETRTGKVLGNVGMLGGFRSANKMSSGLIRSIAYGTAGSAVGNKIGIQKPLPKQPGVYFDPNTNTYKYI